MGLFNALTNVAKAGIAVVASPAAMVADFVTLPSSAYDNKHPFHRTGRMFDAAAKCMAEATKPTKDDA